MNRRKFLERLLRRMSVVVGGYPLVNHLLSADGWAALTGSSDEDESKATVAGPVKYPSAHATLEGYLAKPGRAGLHPALLLVPTNRGLDERIRRLARRFAEEGFVSLIVDPLSRRGGTDSFALSEEVSHNIDALPREQVLADLDAAFKYLQSNPSVHAHRIGIAGFDWGGPVALHYASWNPEMKVAGAFHGATPPQVSMAAVNCPLLVHEGEFDTRPASEARGTATYMNQFGLDLSPEIYSVESMEFFNETGSAYDIATDEAWRRTIAFFRRNLARSGFVQKTYESRQWIGP